jgi:hypothetical protein
VLSKLLSIANRTPVGSIAIPLGLLLVSSGVPI